MATQYPLALRRRLYLQTPAGLNQHEFHITQTGRHKTLKNPFLCLFSVEFRLKTCLVRHLSQLLHRTLRSLT